MEHKSSREKTASRKNNGNSAACLEQFKKYKLHMKFPLESSM